MSNKSIENRIDKKILEEAATHYLSLQDESMSGAELKAWQAWFMRSKDHQQAFRRLETLWGVLEGISENDLADAENSQKLVSEDADASQADVGGSVISLVTKDVAKSTKKPGMLRWYSGVAASFVAALFAGYIVFSSAEVPNQVLTVPYYTSVGEQRVVDLADGSIVELGPDSQLSVEYSPEERAVNLERGQAIFTVSKNPNRPFIVRAGSGSVTAIGTVFNVRRLAEDVQVRVLEGTVAVRPTSEELIDIDDTAVSKPVALITAGNQTFYSDEGSMTPIETVDVHAGLGWRVGVLTMVNRELADVILELNRYVENEVAIGDDAVGKFHFTGTVYPDKVDEWLEGLTQGYPLKVVRVGGRTILMLDDVATTH